MCNSMNVSTGTSVTSLIPALQNAYPVCRQKQPKPQQQQEEQQGQQKDQTCTSFEIPTGTSVASALRNNPIYQEKQRHHHFQQRQGEHSQYRDAFAYYSNDLIRIKELLAKEDDEGMEDLFATEEMQEKLIIQRASEGKFETRKTRISFEVHPYLLSDLDNDLFEDDDDEDIEFV